MKWIWVIVLAIIGILAAIVAVEYLTVSISHVPSFMGGHHARGHFRKRGYGSLLIAIVAFVIAGFLAYRIVRAGKGAAGGSGSETSAEDLLSSPGPSDPAAG